MPKHLPRLHSLAHAIFGRCDPIRGQKDLRHDGSGREIQLSHFGDDDSDFGWMIHQNNEGDFVALHIESYCDLIQDKLIKSLSRENAESAFP